MINDKLKKTLYLCVSVLKINMLMEKKKLPRGIRNNNPLNIERNATKWQGMRKVQTDKRFVQFDSMEYGIRAAFRTLNTYYHKHGCKTLRQFISRWCPQAEPGNETEMYIHYVANKTGISPDRELLAPSIDRVRWIDIVYAMILMECGRPVSWKHVDSAWRMAFKK